MDPLTSLLELFGQNNGSGGGGNATSTALQGAAQGATASQPAAAAQGNQPGLGDILGAIKAPEVKAQFTGGVPGTSLPYKTALTNMISPVMSQLAQPQALPSLGALLSQVPGGR